MKYVLLSVAVLLIVYPIYAILKCLTVFGSLTNYGMGVFIGGLILLFSGSILLYYIIKSNKRKKNSLQ